MGRLSRITAEARVASGGRTRRRSSGSRGRTAVGGRRRRRVLELLLGAEQRVEHLLAQTLAERERGARADDHQQQRAAALALAGLLAAPQGVGGFLQVARRRLKLLLGLLVVEQRLGGTSPVGHAAVGVARGVVGGAQVVAQLLVLDQAVHVRVRRGRLARRYRTSRALRGLLLFRCHGSPRIDRARRLIPDATFWGTLFACSYPPRGCRNAPVAALGRALRSPSGAVHLERLAQHVVDLLDPQELHVVLERRRELVEVDLVLLGGDDALDAGALRGERLLLEPPDRQHLAGKRDLAGHRRV